MSRSGAERGIALLIVLMAMSMLMALGLALTAVTIGETEVASAYDQAGQVFYAAESAGAYALQALAREPDWAAVLDGTRASAFQDPDVLPVLAGEDAPAGRLFAFGWLAGLMPPDAAVARLAVAAWVAEGDEPGLLRLTARAYGSRGARRAIELTVTRVPPPEPRLRIISWREVR
jgi:hypothetical protein